MKGASELLSGPERRRRWSAEEKRRIVAESLAPDAVASDVARRHGLHRNQLYAWRREARPASDDLRAMGFAPIVMVDEDRPRARKGIEIALGGAVIRVEDDADPVLLTRVLKALKRI